MRRFVAVSLCSLMSVADLALTTVIFAQGRDFRNRFLIDVYQYKFSYSLFDLWVLSLFRVPLIIGLILAIIYNPVLAPVRAKHVRKFVAMFAASMWMWTIIKLLGLVDDDRNIHKPWNWGMLVWSSLSSFLFYIQWRILSNIKICDKYKLAQDEEEKEPLINEHKKKGDNSKDKTVGDSKEDEKDVKITKAKIVRLFGYMRPDWLLLVIGFAFLAIAATGNIFIPYYTGQVIDGIAIEKSEEKFIRSIIFMALISLASSVASGIRGGCLFLAVRRLDIRIRNVLFSSIMTQEVGFFDTVKTGDLTSRLTSDTTSTSEPISLNLNVFLRSLITACGTIFFMLKLSWKMSLVTFIGLPIVIGVSQVYGEYFEKLSKKVQDSLAKANEVAEEACSSLKTVRSFANELNEVERYRLSLCDTYKLFKKQALAYAGYMWSNQLFELALTVSVLYYGGHLVINNQITGGNLVSFILYQIELGSCLESMGGVYTGLMQAVGASDKVFEYVDRKPEIANTGIYTPEKLEGKLEFRDVSFAYPSRPETLVLKNVSFSVKPGEVVALVGPSGGGKSSCVNLLEHFYETASGQVLLDSVPIHRYDHKYLHKNISLVGQEPVLYARSIRENIAYGLDDICEEDIQQAARNANAHNFILELSEKYETQTGEKGTQLSGGQKQRIAIARALIRNPVILLLDEATSALDSESEFVVQQALYSNIKGRTVMIIAHRLSTVERAHRIVVVDKGSVVEQGSHQELLAKGGMYANLVKRQILGFDDAPSSTNTRQKSSPRAVTSSATVHTHIGSPDSVDFKSCSNSPVSFLVGSDKTYT